MTTFAPECVLGRYRRSARAPSRVVGDRARAQSCSRPMLRGLLLLVTCPTALCVSVETISGDVKVVGDPDDASCIKRVVNKASDFPSDSGCPKSGAVRVHRLVDGEWVQEAYLKAVDAQAGDEFGASVAVQGDTIMVGARYEDRCPSAANGGESSGNSCLQATVSYAYRRVRGVLATDPFRWIPEAKIGETVVFGPDEPRAQWPAFEISPEHKTRYFNWGPLEL